MLEKEINYYNCREYFRYKTVTPIDENILEKGRKGQKEAAVRLTKKWYQKALELGDTELEEYFRQKISKIDTFASQIQIRAYGTLKQDFFSMLEKQIPKNKIQKIYFLDDFPENFDGDYYDVSAEQNGSIRLWLEKDSEGLELYIGAKGGVTASENCSGLFSGFDHVSNILFQKNLKTENVKNMSEMFARCRLLEETDTENLDTENVENMSCMFLECRNLRTIDISSFNTHNVKNMSRMFWKCESLQSLDMRNFDIGSIQNISNMFGCCRELASFQGIGVLRKLADAGDGESMYFLGTCYENGDEIEKDMPQAMEWYKKSAEAGCAKAYRHIGDCCFAGKGTYRSRKDALDWWEKAAELGDAEASLKAAKELLEHSYNTAQELETIQKFAEKAYQKNYFEAGLVLAQVKKRFGDNMGVTELEKRHQYYQEADQLYEEAEKRMQKNAKAERAYFYITKKYEPEKLKGIKLLEIYAAEQDPLAQYYLGVCYMIGNGVKKDKRYGRLLIQMAAEEGIQQAKKALEKWQIWLA